MKIVYIGKFRRVEDEEVVAEALEANGVEVIRIEEYGITNKEYLERIDKEKPDFVLFAKANVMGSSKDLIQSIKDLGIKTVSWTFDLLIGHPPREHIIDSLEWLKCDYVFLTDGGRTQEYKDKGIDKIVLRQGIPEKFCYMGEPEDKYKYDVVFVGTHNPTYPYRQRTMEFLKETYGDRFHWFGQFNSSEVRGDELNKVCASAKIMIGDSMFAQNYWSNRIYELVGRGAFLITPRIEGLDKEFEYYKEIIPYDIGDWDRLRQKIDYYLIDKEGRDKIRKAGFKRVKENYLYKHRVKEFLKIWSEQSS
jgi:glycosyltransferase involved in cell wall biosynthesis